MGKVIISLQPSLTTTMRKYWSTVILFFLSHRLNRPILKTIWTTSVTSKMCRTPRTWTWRISSNSMQTRMKAASSFRGNMRCQFKETTTAVTVTNQPLACTPRTTTTTRISYQIRETQLAQQEWPLEYYAQIQLAQEGRRQTFSHPCELNGSSHSRWEQLDT